MCLWRSPCDWLLSWDMSENFEITCTFGKTFVYCVDVYWYWYCVHYYTCILLKFAYILDSSGDRFVPFMQGIYNYTPETNHVSKVYSVAAVLYLQFVLLVMLFHLWNIFCTFTLVLSIPCVQCPIWPFL